MKQLILTLLALVCLLEIQAQEHSIAREWNEVLLKAIRTDFARPTVHARNLFHTSIVMYDAWAIFDEEAESFFLGKTLGNYTCEFDGFPTPNNIVAEREAAISFAAYHLLTHRFRNSPGAATALPRFDSLMQALGHDINFEDTNYTAGLGAALGNYLAEQMIAFGLQDGANENRDYANRFYRPRNRSMAPELPGNRTLSFPNSWQPLTFNIFIDQSGNPVPGGSPPFLSPEWGTVVPFSLQPQDLTIHQRFGQEYWAYHDPGEPAYLGATLTGDTTEEYQWGFSLVSVWSSHLDPADGVMWDISPASIGNIEIDSMPRTIEGLRDFYNLEDGGDPSRGHTLNPHTGEPYEAQIVPRADYARVLAEFWADGPESETPPGHWFTILNYVNDHPLFEKRFRGKGDILEDLEWDVKSYLALGGTMHDAAVTAWGLKGWYDYIRPVSAIRYMARLGQSTSSALPNYHFLGLPLQDGFIELVQAGDPLVGANNEHLNKVKLYAWRGPDFIQNPDTDLAGVGWILAENWWPYQRPTFVTPPFAGYISGHSTFSRAAAEMMTLLTGDAFFPGGMGEFDANRNEFLVFEEGPSVDLTLQWATYRDASDQTSLSRIWGGIHPPVDDIPGRLIGEKIGVAAFHFAEEFFYQDFDNDGYFSYEDCDDFNELVNPGHPELCDALDNNCNGIVNDGLPVLTYYLDEDGDGYGDPEQAIDTCLTVPPTGYVTNNVDCDSSSTEINPDAIEICDGIDNDCNGIIDDGLPRITYYLDEDGDGFGAASKALDTCLTMPPAGYVTNAQDCDDLKSDINPTISEICDGIDNDCNGIIDDGLPRFRYYLDSDEDGFGNSAISVDTCQAFPPIGYVIDSTDCDDKAPNTFPGATEIADNGIDEDCSGIDLFKETKFFPNPTQDLLTVHYDYTAELTVEILDVTGRLLRTNTFVPINNFFQVDFSDLPQAVYILHIKDKEGDRLIAEKIIRQ